MSAHPLPDGWGTITSYYSATGTVMVQTLRSATGAIESIEQTVIREANGRMTTRSTVVLPAESAWATSSSTLCSSQKWFPCYADSGLFSSPSLIRRLLREHVMSLSRNVTNIEGRSVAELLPVGSQQNASLIRPPLVWVDPTNDEVVRLLQYPTSPPASASNFSWLPNTTSNLRHLGLSIPRGYFQESSGFAASPVGNFCRILDPGGTAESCGLY
jgi:hypothetical protein